MTYSRTRVVSLTVVLAAGVGLAAGGCAKPPPEPAAPRVEHPPPAAAEPPATAPDPAPAPPAPPAPPKDLASATRDNPLRPVARPSTGIRNEPPHSKEPPRLAALKLPPGFSIEVYSADVPNARSIALGAPGIVYVSTRRDNRVYAVVDKDGDRKADKVYTIAKGLDVPNGIAYRDGNLYVAQIKRLLRFDKIDSHLANPPRPVVITDKLPSEEHHGWRYLRFGPDGWLYMPIGAPCNICKRDEPIFATIARIKPEGGDLEIFARGVRNSVGFDWHPQTHELWFTDNGRDDLGDDLPPDELDHAPRAGMHFGFPHCHAGVILDPEFGDSPCTEFEPPVQRLAPHAAALGMRFYTGSMFPAEYKNAIIIAEHGSWNREHKMGYRVMVVKLDGDKAVSYEPLITGWLDDPSDAAWGRPVDVEQLDDGSLLISDDWTGVLYRVTYRK
jgi:glucose/arabinose dehydrogenase